MRPEIADRLRALALQEGLDAIVVCSPENFSYVAGFVVPSQSLLRHRHAMAIVSSEGAVTLFGVDMEASTIRSKAPAADLVVWKEFSDNAMSVLAAALSERGFSAARIGFELGFLPASDFALLAEKLPAATFTAIDAAVARLRQIKTPSEIDLLGRLSRIADKSIADALGSVTAGDTEMDIAGSLTRNIFEAGADDFKLMIIATGERSQLPNVGPSTRSLRPRDVCRVEIFSVIDGYQAGVCRTAVVEEAPAHADEIWRVLVDCKYMLLDEIRPGASCKAIYAKFLDMFERHRLPPISFVAHGIGLFLHEDPYVSATPTIGSSDDALLEAGMVLGFEPLCYRTGHGYGMQNKDMLVVTETGCTLLSDHTDTDQLLVIT